MGSVTLSNVYQIVERDVDSKIVSVHRITISDDNARGGWYRQVTSMSGFLSRCRNRWHDYWIKKRGKWGVVYNRFSWWNDQETEMYNETRSRTEKHGLEMPEIKFRDHGSLWSFYDHIGYDYKNKSKKHIDSMLLFKE